MNYFNNNDIILEQKLNMLGVCDDENVIRFSGSSSRRQHKHKIRCILFFREG